jgi:site-specific DNA-cytosine methylase|tara:strand:- start:1533 stop:2213 length:681 start_codon:yes stop_codon:yes gene_type:complete
MNVLELFSGTGSVGKCCDKLGWNVISVDLELPATHECDIMDFDYKQYPQDHFSVVWASPPCTYYSSLQNCWIGRKKKDGIITTKEIIEENRIESDKLIEKTLEIINYFKPDLWFMENPQRGQLKNRDVVKGIPYYDVSYCMYSDWGYEKRTRIWTNKKDWNNLICDKSGDCGNMVESQHKKVCDGGYDKRKKHKHKKDVSIDYGSGTNRLERYRVPEDLIFSLLLD